MHDAVDAGLCTQCEKDILRIVSLQFPAYKVKMISHQRFQLVAVLNRIDRLFSQQNPVFIFNFMMDMIAMRERKCVIMQNIGCPVSARQNRLLSSRHGSSWK